MSKKTKQQAATIPPRAKAPAAKPHQPRDGRCAVCRRTGASLKLSCPGYATAADVFDAKTKAQIDPLTTHPGKPAAKQRKQKGGKR